MDPISLIIFIAVGGVLIGAGVHFIPVGGAPAAMATATGVGTGTAMLAAGAGMTGLVTAASLTGQSMIMVMLLGAVGAMIMMAFLRMLKRSPSTRWNRRWLASRSGYSQGCRCRRPQVIQRLGLSGA